MRYLTLKDKSQAVLVVCRCKLGGNGFSHYIRANFYFKDEIYNTWEIAQLCNYKMSKNEKMIVRAYGMSPVADIADKLAKKLNIDFYDILIDEL